MQTPEERVEDSPRLMVAPFRNGVEGKLEAKELRTIVQIANEHNRTPGQFDYNYPQEFYSLLPEIEQETFITLGSDQKRRVR